ncbi:MAG: glutamine synthetase family protein [Parvibaculum sp.]|nr:glutamine synthetase family protein [Parvibaculum sp.]
MNGMLSLDQLSDLVAAGDIDTVVMAMPDMQGRLIGKRMAAPYFLDTAVHETHPCNYLLTADTGMEPVPGYKAASWLQGYGDFTLKPDLATLRLIPWLPGTALVICDTLDQHGEDVPHAPRSMLKKQLKRVAAMKMKALTASELEFYLFDDSYESAHEKRYRGLKSPNWYIEDYHVFATTKEEGIMRAIRTGLEGAGIPVESSKGEWGPGQEEINIRYAEALEMADRHTILKNGIKEIAWLHGKAVTFMAKWNDELAGSSCHIHMSLWDEKAKTAHFYDEDSRPHGMSGLCQSFLAGQLRHAREIGYFLAPAVNSYKRFVSGSFAPTNIVWSNDNRTAGFRMCGHGNSLRIECRIGGADLNPYLAYAALLAAGLQGVENNLVLEPEFTGDAYESVGIPSLPKNLRDSLSELEQSDVLRAALGDEVVEHYLHTGRWEQTEYERRITDWELVRGFERG